MRFPRPLAGLLFAFLSVAATAQSVTPPLAGQEIAPRLRAAAAAAGVALSDTTPAAGSPRTTDSVVLWLGSADGKRTTQWLVQLSRPIPPRPAAGSGKTSTHYLSWGREVTFVSTLETLDLWIAGPVAADAAAGSAPVPTRRVQIQIPADYLRLGLDGAARACMQIAVRSADAKERGQPIDLNAIYAFTKPADPRNQPAALAAATALGFTPEMERAWIGGMVALGSFYEAADGVRELKEIATPAVKRPSAWKLLKAVGGAPFATSFNAQLAQEVDPAAIGIHASPAPTYRLPFTFALDSDLITWGELIVTKPAGAFQLTAGILGLVVVHPEDPHRVVQLSVIATHH